MPEHLPNGQQGKKLSRRNILASIELRPFLRKLLGQVDAWTSERLLKQLRINVLEYDQYMISEQPSANIFSLSAVYGHCLAAEITVSSVGT